MTAIQNNESRWTVIANGKQVANGTTIRRNGRISHFVSTESEKKEEENEKINNAESPPIAFEDEERPLDKELCDALEPVCPSLKVNTSCIKSTNEALSTVIHQLKWKESKGNIKLVNNVADMYWHGAGFDEGLYNKPGVYAVNKLPGMVQLSQKIHLSKIIKRMQLLFPGEFDFYPPTWFLPQQYHQFVAEVSYKTKGKLETLSSSTPLPDTARSRRKTSTYIVKPDCGSQGEGIYLVNDPRDVQDVIGAKPAVVQKYIDDPLLLDNFKFDLRMYVTVARLHPVEIYLCKDGLARLCTVEYETPRPSNINNAFMHLTNYSLNKFSEDFLLTSAGHTGSKRTYKAVRNILQKRGYDVNKIHQQIVDLVVKTVLSLIPDVTIWDHVTNRSRCVRTFQILGFDILLTSDLKAHLLEVNSSPSMGIDMEIETSPGVFETVTSAVDEQIKVPLLRDVLKLIAYGEGELNMERTCLERVYPAPNTPSLLCNQRMLPQTSLKSRKIDNNHLCHSLSESDNHIHKNPEVGFSAEHKESNNLSSALDLGRSNKSVGRKTVDITVRDFDNPLLRDNGTPRFQFGKRPKKFTVIKYKQEYAISTEEWRLFQLRSKVSSQLVALRNLSLRQSFPNLTFRKRPQTPSTPRNETFSTKIHNTEVLCKICGHYIGGVGPGLYRTQLKYRKSLEQNGLHKLPRQDDFGKPSWPSDEVLDSLKSRDPTSEWESGVEAQQASSFPARSIYFSFAQSDHRRMISPHAHKRIPLPGLENETSHREICDNCLESSSTSSSEDITIKFKANLPTSTNPRSKLHFHRKPEQGDKPDKFSVNDLLVIRRAAAIFIFFNGCKPSLRISATNFRNMARKCHLCDAGAMPAVDILFIDVMRQWQRQISDHSTPYYDTFRVKNPITSHQTPGLPFQGFLEAIFRIAKARVKGGSLKEKLETLVTGCEQYMKEANKTEEKTKKKRKEAHYNQIYTTSPSRISGGLSARQPYL